MWGKVVLAASVLRLGYSVHVSDVDVVSEWSRGRALRGLMVPGSDAGELPSDVHLYPQVYFRPVWASYRELMRRSQADAVFMVGPGPGVSRKEGEEGGVG